MCKIQYINTIYYVAILQLLSCNLQVIHPTLHVNILCDFVSSVLYCTVSLCTAREIFLEGGPVAASVPRARYAVCMSEKMGGKAKKRTPLSPCEVGTLGKIEAKKKVNWTVLKMYSVNYCISVKQEIPNLRFTLGICSSSCSGIDCLIKTYELKICYYTASLRQSRSSIVPSLPLSLLKQMATVCLPYLFKWLFVNLT